MGSTALAQRLGDAAADAVRREHFELLRRAVSATGGTEVKTIGDAMMVSYNSASDAIAGAVAMQRRVQTHNTPGDPATVQMRVGISAGDASFEDGDWFGTPVVEAARLCGAADGDQILVTDIVRVLAGSRAGHELRSIGEVDGKGLAAPMSACEVVWEPVVAEVGAIEVGLPPQVEQTDVFGFVGRGEQKDALWGAWKTATATGRMAVFIGGEPGIGKTRIVKELCRDAHHQGGVVLWGACDEELALPYQPFVEALRWLAQALPPDVLADLVGPAGGELIPVIPDLTKRVSGLEPRLADDAETERYRLFEAVAELLRDLSGRAPVMLVLDDLHWARKPTLLLLRHLLKSSMVMNLLIVATYRDTDLDRTHPLAEMLADLRRQAGVERLVLRGLDEAGVQQFLAHTAGHDLDERGIVLASAIAAETEGNPFFVGEVLRHLSESGALVYRDGRWSSDRQLADLGIPQGVREVIGRRLSNLDQSANDVLATAAVIGREFELRTLGAVAGGADAVLDALGSAERAGLVEPVNGRPGAYRFAHALVRSALYDELPTSRRLRLHRDVGVELERGGADSSRLAELARHFTEAAALGEVDKAVRYSQMAGDAAIADLACEEAAAHFERALEAIALQSPVDQRLRARLLFAAGNALHQISDPRGRQLLTEAESAAVALDDLHLLAEVLVSLAGDVPIRAASEVDARTVDRFDQLLARGGELTDAVRARVMSAYSRELFWSRRPAEVRRRLCDEALAIARRLGDRQLLAEVLSSVNFMIDLTEPNGLDQLESFASESIEVAAGVDDSLVCHALAARTVARGCRGEIASAVVDLEHHEQLADRLRIPVLVSRARMNRVALALLAGRLDECAVLLADWEAYAAASIVSHNPAAAASVRYRLQYERGELAPLETLLTQLIDAQPLIPTWRMALCGVYLQSDRTELCRPHVEAIGADDFAMVPRNQAFLLSCSSAARMAGEAGVLDVAEAAHRHAAEFDDVFPYSGAVFEYPVGVGVGAAATALGWFDRAEQHYANAYALCERAGAPTYLAATQVYWAEMLRRRAAPGDAARAVEMATAASATSLRLGLGYMLERANRLLVS